MMSGPGAIEASYSHLPDNMTINQSITPSLNPSMTDLDRPASASPSPTSAQPNGQPINQSISLNSLSQATFAGSRSSPPQSPHSSSQAINQQNKQSPYKNNQSAGSELADLGPSNQPMTNPQNQPNNQSRPMTPQFQQFQQQQQRPQSGPQSTTQSKPGFFSSLFNNNRNSGGSTNQPAQSRQPINQSMNQSRVPPLVTYMERLRLVHRHHLKNISNLTELRKKFAQSKIDDVIQYKNYGYFNLVKLAELYYLIHAEYVILLLNLEGKYMHNLEKHIMVANAVCDHRYSEKIIEKEMFSDQTTNQPNNPSSINQEYRQVRTQEDIDALFWPSDAEQTKITCRSLGNELKRIETIYQAECNRLKKRESINDRLKRLIDCIQYAYATRDSLEVDMFHHHSDQAVSITVYPAVNQSLNPLMNPILNQSVFNQLMFDQRGDEGKFLKQFLDYITQSSINQSLQPITPPAILSFINQFVGKILGSYRIDDRFMPIVRLFVDRLVFPLVAPAINQSINPANSQTIAQLNAKSGWLKSLTPEQLGIQPNLLPIGYVHAISQPNDQLPGQSQDQSADNSNDQPTTPSIKSQSFNAENPLAPLPKSSSTQSIKQTTAEKPAEKPAEQSADPLSNQSASQLSDQPFTRTGKSLDAPEGPVVVPSVELPVDLSFYFNQSTNQSINQSNPFATNPYGSVKQALAQSVDQPIPQVPSTFPYHESINQMNQLINQSVPFDMFFVIVQSARLVVKEARKYRLNQSVYQSINQSRLISKNDPFASFMTKLVDESQDEINKLNEQLASQSVNQADLVNGQPVAHPLTAGQSSTNSSATDPLANPLANQPPTQSTSDSTVSSTPQSLVAPDQSQSGHQRVPSTGSQSINHTQPSVVPVVPQPSPALQPRPVAETPLLADDLFPLMTWVIIHSNLQAINQAINQIDRFVPMKLTTSGEAAVAYTNIASAMHYIEQVTPETLGKSTVPDEEEDHSWRDKQRAKKEAIEQANKEQAIKDANEQAIKDAAAQSSLSSIDQSTDQSNKQSSEQSLPELDVARVSSDAQIASSPSANLISPSVNIVDEIHPVEESNEESISQSANQSNEVTEQSNEQSAEQSNDPVVESSSESAEQPVEQSVEQPTEVPLE